MKTSTIFSFIDPDGCLAKCHLAIVDNLVIATELGDNPGMSITNCAEHLAELVVDTFNISKERLIWIEHDDGSLVNWDIIKFKIDASSGKFQLPKWHRISTRFFPSNG